jgi:hypothetical protein
MRVLIENVANEFARIVTGITTAAAATMLGLNGAHAAQAGLHAASQVSPESVACSTSDIEGPYAYSQATAFNSFQGPQGSISAFAPVALLGRYVFDGHGDVSRSMSVSLAGGPAFTVQDPGTYVVNPDCTGSVSFPDLGESLSFVVVSMKTIAIGTTTPGEVGVGALQKQESQNCTLDSLRGNYVYTANGGFVTFAALSVPPNPPLHMDAFLPVSAVGLLSFDRRGGVKRNFPSVNFGGGSFPYADAGAYTVSEDCTGSVFFPSDGESFSLVLVNSRTVLAQVELPGAVGLATIVRQDLDQ